MAVLDYLSKWKRYSGTSLCCTFSVWFVHKNVLHLIFYLWTKLQCDNVFPSHDIKQHMLLSYYLTADDVINLKIYLGSSSKAMTDREKDEKREILKFENLENENNFLDGIKNIFDSFWRATIWWKIKIAKK